MHILCEGFFVNKEKMYHYKHTFFLKKVNKLHKLGLHPLYRYKTKQTNCRTKNGIVYERK